MEFHWAPWGGFLIKITLNYQNVIKEANPSHFSSFCHPFITLHCNKINFLLIWRLFGLPHDALQFLFNFFMPLSLNLTFSSLNFSSSSSSSLSLRYLYCVYILVCRIFHSSSAFFKDVEGWEVYFTFLMKSLFHLFWWKV